MQEYEKSNKTFTYDEISRIIEDSYTECYEEIPELKIDHPVEKGIKLFMSKIEDNLLSLM